MYEWIEPHQVSELLGVTLLSVDNLHDDVLVFTAQDGRQWALQHTQECCESVRIVDVCGDLSDLVETPILVAEEVSNEGAPPPEYPDSYTWTFYKFGTIKGSVTVRWLGESNGYYSESVDFVVITGADDVK